jgi:hypothetical protein
MTKGGQEIRESGTDYFEKFWCVVDSGETGSGVGRICDPRCVYDRINAILRRSKGYGG